MKALEKKVLRVLPRLKVTFKNYFFNIYSVRVAAFKLIAKRIR